jgi:hypothetical protein
MKLLLTVLLAMTIGGPLVAGEKKIQMKDLPAAVQTAVHQVTYEAQVEKNGRKSEVVVDAAGKRIKG